MSQHPDDANENPSDAVEKTQPAPERYQESTRQLETELHSGPHPHSENELPSRPPVLGKYVISGLIGRGGMGVVWKGFDPDLQRTVAIKVLGEHLAHSPTARRRFQREGRAAAAISHPNVVTVHAVEEHAGVLYLVMEFVPGGSLKEHVARCGKLEPIEVIRLSCQIAQGLAAAHLQGVIHRDVKPGNVMLHEGASRVRLSDFGLARVAYDNVELTSHDQIVGTPAYTSPEQIQGARVDARTDLFSLGCVMHYMLTGHSPWLGRTQAETIHKIVTTAPPSLLDRCPNTPPALVEIVERLLQKRPDDRFQSAYELADILRQFLRELNQSPTDEMQDVLNGQRVAPVKASRRWRGLISACLAGALVAAGAAFTKWGLPLLNRETPPSATPAALLTSPDIGSKEQAAGLLPKLKSITVGPDEGADFHTISQAIAHAAEDCTITVIGPGPYAEAVNVQGAALRGLTLQAQPRATWSCPAPAGGTCLSISDTADISVDGFDFQIAAEMGRAVAVSGDMDGLSLVDCEFRHQLPAHKISLVKVDSNTVDGQEPVRILRSRFHTARGPVMGLVVGAANSANTRVHCEECRFISANTHIYVQNFQRLSLARNVFVGGANGVNIGMKSWSPDRRIEVVNNTFVQTRYWLGLMDSFRGGNFPAPPSDSRVCNNLILGGERVQGGVDQWEPVLSAWKFAGNVWEIDDSTKQAANYGNRIADFQATLSVPVRDDPDDPAFLQPVADSSLFTAGVGDDLPRYVGAKGPSSAP